MSDAFLSAPFYVAFRSNGMNIELRGGNGSACATVCVKVGTESDGGVSVLANVVVERGILDAHVAELETCVTCV